ncbi:MAG: hypothetical protein DRP09_17205, partial [Candidatus Thorarchaeota archaeon]
MKHIQVRIRDIVYFDLGETRGHETNKTRPCLVTAIPSEAPHGKGPAGMVVVLPLTSSQHNFWTEVRVRKKGKMKNDSFVLCHQIRALDSSRAERRIA